MARAIEVRTINHVGDSGALDNSFIIFPMSSPICHEILLICTTVILTPRRRSVNPVDPSPTGGSEQGLMAHRLIVIGYELLGSTFCQNTS